MKMKVKVTGEGSPLVLVPGVLTGRLGWEPYAERLASTRKVVRVQPLCVQYGLNNLPIPPDYSVKMESVALAATLDELGLNTALDIVAWSHGALVTLDYALNNATRVRSLMLVEPTAFWVLQAIGGLDTEAEKTVAMLQTLRGDISEAQLEQFLYSFRFCPNGKSPHKLPQWPLWLQYRQSLRSCPGVLKHHDDPKRLRDFHRPVLLVKGTDSARFLHQIVDALAALLPRARVVEMAGGHAAQIVSMDGFVQEMEAFQISVLD